MCARGRGCEDARVGGDDGATRRVPHDRWVLLTIDRRVHIGSVFHRPGHPDLPQERGDHSRRLGSLLFRRYLGVGDPRPGLARPPSTVTRATRSRTSTNPSGDSASASWASHRRRVESLQHSRQVSFFCAVWCIGPWYSSRATWTFWLCRVVYDMKVRAVLTIPPNCLHPLDEPNVVATEGCVPFPMLPSARVGLDCALHGVSYCSGPVGRLVEG